MSKKRIYLPMIEIYRRVRIEGESLRSVGRDLGVSHTTIGKRLKEHERKMEKVPFEPVDPVDEVEVHRPTSWERIKAWFRSM